MRVAITGATGLVGRRVVARLQERGDEVTILTRDPSRAPRGVEAHAWSPVDGPAPAAALAGRDAVVHLAGENIAQRWTVTAKRRIRESRELGTRNLVAGLKASDPRPGVLVSASGAGFYGPRGDEEVTESTPPGEDFLAGVCVAWEREARAAEHLGVRVVTLRTGVALDASGGALAKMLPPFRLGVGGPVAGGRQWLPWIHADDLAAMYVTAIEDERWTGPVNATSPAPATNRDFSEALGRALRRPAVVPVPALALRLRFGEMAMIVTTGQRVVPARALALGFRFDQPELLPALRDALGR